MNLFDKEFFNMTTGFAVIVVLVLAFISYIGTRLESKSHQATPTTSYESTD